MGRSFPETTVVVTNLVTPLGTCSYNWELTLPAWEQGIRALAEASPNVHMKLCGFGSPLLGFHFDDREVPAGSTELAEAFRCFVTPCLEAFGPGRCFFGSN